MSPTPEHYPGSKQPLVDYSKPQEVPEEMQLEAALGRPYKAMRYRGERKPFYSIGSLARALNRAPVTIRKLQDDGVIPPPTFTSPGERRYIHASQVRLYTREQIAGLRKIAQEEGILIDTWKAIKDTNFKDRARELFEELSK